MSHSWHSFLNAHNNSDIQVTITGMSHSSASEFHAKCNTLRAAAKQLMKELAARPQEQLCDGATTHAPPATLRMSMGEVRKKRPVTLCTFTRSELMVRQPLSGVCFGLAFRIFLLFAAMLRCGLLQIAVTVKALTI